MWIEDRAVHVALPSMGCPGLDAAVGNETHV